MDRPGDIIILAAGAWRLRAPLATSSYGVLWRAEGALSGLPAVLKLVNRAQMDAAAPELRRYWLDGAAAELAFLRALQPWDARHIVRLLDHGEHAGCPVLALEALDGDLKSRLDAQVRRTGNRAVPFAQALDWIGQVNGALARVHQYGWRHLDLKPANLLVDAATGTIKVADFGTCRPLAERAPHAYSGTAGWQAPEQWLPGPDARYRTDARTDYFALGLLFYALVAGTPLRHAGACAQALRAGDPVSGGQALAAARPVILAADEAARFARLASNAGAGDALALLRALLAPCPADRPAHAVDISRLIDRLRDGAPRRQAAAWRQAA